MKNNTYDHLCRSFLIIFFYLKIYVIVKYIIADSTGDFFKQ